MNQGPLVLELLRFRGMTHGVRNVVVLAEHEALRLGHDSIGLDLVVGWLFGAEL